ncbi:hypothetical protein YB2330_002075 [Saitoella coloradoensis]
MTFTLNWGILGCGGIAETFTKDILVDPKSHRNVDVIHKVVAIGSSSSVDKAKKFAETTGAKDAKHYGSYEELVKDENVDVIYVATPHSHHYANTMLALEAGKNVLCEKAFTVNAAQARKLVETARAKNLFLMEAQWTRYFPLSIELRRMISSGKLGDIKQIFSDNGKSIEHIDRITNPNLAGGALLDLGVYSFLHVFQTVYHLDPEHVKPEVKATILKDEKTGVDKFTTAILAWPGTTAIATCNYSLETDPKSDYSAGPCVRIVGTKAQICIPSPPYRPTSFTVIPNGDGEIQKKDFPIEGGNGMWWEADEVAFCIRDGKKESEIMPLDESVVIMETYDEIRKQGDFRYPEALETLDVKPMGH